MPSTGDHRPAGGFTLIELIVVLIIVALMAVFAVPRLLPADSSTALKTQAEKVASILRRTRSEAIRSNRNTWVEIDTVARNIEGDGNSGTYELPENVSLKLVSATEEKSNDEKWRIRFYPDGSSSGGRISLIGQGRDYHIDVEWFTGHVAIIN